MSTSVWPSALDDELVRLALRSRIGWPPNPLDDDPNKQLVDALYQQMIEELHVEPGEMAVAFYPKVESTNTMLLRWIQRYADDMQPTLLITKEQTAAHGRMGRPWVAEADGALTFSLALPLAPKDCSGLSLAIGLTLAEALHPDIRIKWPNDLQIGGRKLAGILIEIASGWAVIGVGINLRAPAPGSATAAALEAHGVTPAWLDELLPGITAPAALLRVAAPLVAAVRTFERTGFAPLQERFAARDALAGLDIQLSDGSAGTACGVAPDGALRVRTAQGIIDIRSSAVSVRPAATTPAHPC